MYNKILSYLRNHYSLSWYLASRRLLPKSDSPGLVLLPRLAFLSILIGVTASILILSLANGLHNHYLRRLAESDSHISVLSIGRGIPAYQEIIQQIKTYPEVTTAYPYSQNEALLKSYGETAGILLKAYPSNFTDDPTFNEYFQLEQGTWSFNTSRTITIGKALARNMALFVGDFLEILTYDEDFGTITYRFKISGIFSASDGLLDRSVAFISFDDAGEIFSFQGYAPYIGIRIQNHQNPEKLARTLTTTLPFSINTWKLANLNTLAALQNEKQIIRVLLLIFFCVAFFGILAVMTAMIIDKREEIALLKTLGMTPQENVSSFLWTGLFLGVTASTIGVILGVFLSMNFNNIIQGIEIIVNSALGLYAFIFRQEISYQFNILNQNVYYLKEFPILIQWGDILFSVCVAIFCTLIATVYPALISKKFKAAEILRKRAF
ncbi:MAG: ABC transporter permease [Brevinema sp.]